MKKGLLAVSFGTSHMDTLEKTIGAVEKELGEHFPEHTVYRAFTSGMIIRKLRLTMDLEVDTVEEALQRMERDGVKEVLVQPTHIINGYENDRMLETIRQFSSRFDHIFVGDPLLTVPEDYRRAVAVLTGEIKLEENEALVLMGHGTEHHANAAYSMLEYMFRSMGQDSVFVGTVEGFPALLDVMERLREKKLEKVALLPFMLVAGDHAKNDMAGEDDSWRCAFLQEGYSVRTIMKGLGEFSGIREIFTDHAENARELELQMSYGRRM